MPLLVQHTRRAVGLTLGLADFLRQTDRQRSTIPAHPLFEFDLRLEHNLQDLVDRSRLLSWAPVPYSTRGKEGPLPAGFSLPATFRPQGLVTLSTAYALLTLAGLVSCRRRSWDSPFGAFPTRKAFRRYHHPEPTYRFTAQRILHSKAKPDHAVAVPGL